MKRYYGVIVAVLTIVLGIGIAYAAFSQQLNIGGTAKTTGNWDIEFDKTNTKLSSQTGSTGATITVAENGKSATVSAPALEYPGAYAIFNVVVKNSGTINATLNEIVPVGLTSDPNIEVTFEGGTPAAINANTSQTFTLKVEWKATSAAYTEEPISFSIVLDYQQAV